MRPRIRHAPCSAALGIISVAALFVFVGFSGSAKAYHNGCDSTSYWNVSWCLYGPQYGHARVRAGTDLRQGVRIAWDSANDVHRKFIHITGGGSWIESGQTVATFSGDEWWVFYFVASTEKVGCFNPATTGNAWVNCRRCAGLQGC
jgi:hypothetical protein